MAAPNKFCQHIFLRNLRKSKLLITLSFCRYIHAKKSVAEILRSPVLKSQDILLQGWVRSVREHKNVVFIHVTDGSVASPLQVVIDPKLCKGTVTFGSCVSIKGAIVESPFPGQQVELQATELNVLGICDSVKYPFKVKMKHSLDYTRNFPHLRSRTNFTSAMMRVRNSATMAVHKYFQEHGFCFVHTPILTSNDCEGAGEVFVVKPLKADLLDEIKSDGAGNNGNHFFGTPAFLTVSGQLHLEAMTGAFSKVYNFGPTFRAENSRGRHHLSEFYMVEAEIAFTETLEDIIQVMEHFIKSTVQEVMNKSEEDVHFFHKFVAPEGYNNIIKKMIDGKFVRLSYTEAVEKLEENNEYFQFKMSWGKDLQKEHEKYLVSWCGDVPVFVTDFPTHLKPFYTRWYNQEGGRQTAASTDLLAPGVGELFGGTLREERADILKHRLEAFGLDNQLAWYLELRELGSAPHGGFGMGFERYLQCLLGVQNIQDVIPFPRSPKNCKL